MYTLMHEHIYLDLSVEKSDDDCLLDDFSAMATELIDLKNHGISRICDVTNIGIGRNIAYVDKMAKKTGIDIISCTGCYKDPFIPDTLKASSIKQLAALFTHEIEHGIEHSGRKAQLIGEVGTSFNEITTSEEKVLIASSIAANNSGKWITTHTSFGTMGIEQVLLFKNHGVDLTRVILGHIDLANDLDYCLCLLDHGVNIEFDTIGKTHYLRDEDRANLLATLLKRQYHQQLFISMDITRKSHLKEYGGIGYDYLFTQFIPRLLELGVTEPMLHHLLKINPDRVFN